MKTEQTKKLPEYQGDFSITSDDFRHKLNLFKKSTEASILKSNTEKVHIPWLSKKITWVVTNDLCYNKLKIKVFKSSKVEQNNVITGCPQDSKTEVNITNNSKFCINLDSHPIEIYNIYINLPGLI